MQHIHGIIRCMFDCWTDPVVHLLLLGKELHHLNMSLNRAIVFDKAVMDHLNNFSLLQMKFFLLKMLQNGVNCDVTGFASCFS